MDRAEASQTEERIHHGDLVGAGRRIATAIAADSDDRRALELAVRLGRAASDVEFVTPVPEDPRLAAATTALRAYLLALRGDVGAGAGLLMTNATTGVGAGYLHWLRGWPVEGIDATPVLDGAARLRRSAETSTESRPALSTAADFVDRISKSAPEAAPPVLCHVQLLRALGEFDAAVSVASAYFGRAPGVSSSVILAGARRAGGDLDGAVDALATALDHAPDDVSILRDLAELELAQGRHRRAEAHYRSVLRLRPSDVDAALALDFVRASGLGDSSAIARIHVAAESGDERAQELVDRIRPTTFEDYRNVLPLPREPLVTRWRAERAEPPAEIELECLPSPSAVEAVRISAAEIGVPAPTIRAEAVPRPDPRFPGVAGVPRTREYVGHEATPTVGPPKPETARAVAEIAAGPFDVERWERLAAGRGRKDETGLLATMVHVPLPVPEAFDAIDWVWRVQVAAALCLAETKRGPSMLEGLVRARADWIAAAAAIAWTRRMLLARPAERRKALETALETLSMPPSIGAWPLEIPLARGALRLTDPGSDEHRTLLSILSSAETSPR